MRQIEHMEKVADLKSLTAGDVMETTVRTCAPDVRAVDVARRLSEADVGSIPIVDEDRTLRGLVTESDLLDLVLAGKDLRAVTAGDIMTRKMVTVTADMPILELINLFQDRFLIRVPVVKDMKLVGLVARRDALYGCLKALEG